MDDGRRARERARGRGASSPCRGWQHLSAACHRRLDLLLLVFEPGALFSAGDADVAQGDGEVAISGIGCGMEFTLRFRLRSPAQGLFHSGPQLRRPAGSLTPGVDAGGWYNTFGVEPDLLEGSRQAVRAMIDHLGREHGLSREDAYILCSLAGDLKITELVDTPNWMVGCFMPDAVFTEG